ncbi:head-tail connector protein [Hoeflea sp. YIM 152468]|uniref:head-tail connector protein n=1 Tax=Hoeflea sp. YIM 152468 TaxID=3031759 RepID=UPI0023DA2299|nr:head-tail connector protein [Hoeflea sp. YIM 152468]MDF1606959.1 head-tail connector protein [Hoeflea sp. YIM 152468]
MHRPVLVAPPAGLPVSLVEAKLHLRVDHADDDTLITSLLGAAVDHLDGWSGILGRSLVEQEWRQDFDAFSSCLSLPLGPVISITSVDYTDANGDPAIVDSGSYSLKTDAGGRSRVEFDGVSVSGSVSITYLSGYPTTPEVPADGEIPAIPAQSTVPAAIKTAILLLIGNWYENRESVVTGTIASELPLAVDALIAPYRRVGV